LQSALSRRRRQLAAAAVRGARLRRPPRSFSFGTATAADGVARGAVMQGAPRGGKKFTSRMTLRAMVRAQMRQADCKEHSRRGARLRLRQLTLTPLSFESFLTVVRAGRGREQRSKRPSVEARETRQIMTRLPACEGGAHQWRLIVNKTITCDQVSSRSPQSQPRPVHGARLVSGSLRVSGIDF